MAVSTFALAITSSGLSLLTPDGATTAVSLPSEVSATGKRARGGTIGNLTIAVNSFSPALWLNLDATVGSLPMPVPYAPTIAAGSGTGYTGTVRAKVSFLVKDAAGNVLFESALSPASGALTITNKTIAWSAIPVASVSWVNARRLYRTAANGTSYFWDQDIDDNTTTTFENATADAALDIVAVNSADLVTAPAGLDNIVQWRGRFWGRSAANPDTVYATGLTNFASWPFSTPIQPVASDQFGITGFLPRRDDLVILKRRIVWKIVGDSTDNFRAIKVFEGKGSLSPDTCIVNRDIGYWLGEDGVYEIEGDDIHSISDEKVRSWFTTDTYFNRAQFPNAFAGYDPISHSYVLFLCSAGSTTIDRWVTYSIAQKVWLGPHKTGAFTPSCAYTGLDSNGVWRLLIGGSDGYIYTPTDGQNSDATSTAVDFDVISKFHSGSPPEPDRTHVWQQPTIFTKKETGGTLTVTPTVGGTDASAGTAQSHDLTKEREKLARLGAGRLCQLEFRQNTAGQGVELYGYELPYTTLGRR